IYVPRGLVSVTGTIQEAVLRSLLSEDGGRHFDNGLAARFLMAMPPERIREWRDAAISAELVHKYVSLFDDLLSLAPEVCPETGHRQPVLVCWSHEAKARFVQFYNEHAQEMRDFKSERLKSAWSKLEAQAARLALVFHCIRHAYLPAPEGQARHIG